MCVLIVNCFVLLDGNVCTDNERHQALLPVQRLRLYSCVTLDAQAELLRTTCAVLIRRIMVPSGPHWARLDGSAKTALRAGLLSATGTEPSSSVARKVLRSMRGVDDVLRMKHKPFAKYRVTRHIIV